MVLSVLLADLQGLQQCIFWQKLHTNAFSACDTTIRLLVLLEGLMKEKVCFHLLSFS